jgi:WD40 repeat protein
MKKLLLIFLFTLLSVSSVFAMGSSVTFISSDGKEIAFSELELAVLNSGLLKGIFEEYSSDERAVIPVDIDLESLEFIKELLSADDEGRLLAEYSKKDNWTDFVRGLDYLQATDLLKYVFNWVDLHVDFSKFNGSNLFTKGSFFLRSFLIEKIQKSMWCLSSLRKNQIITKIPYECRCVAVAPNNSFIVAGGSVAEGGGAATLWKLNEAFEPVEKFFLDGHAKTVSSIAISSDSSFVVTGSDRTVRIWKLNESHELVGEQVLLRHEGGVNSVAIASDNSFIAVAVDGGKVKIWTLDENHEPIGESLASHYLHAGPRPTVVAISSDSTFIAVGLERVVEVWKLDVNHEFEKVLFRFNCWSPVEAIVISDDNSFIIVGDGRGTVRRWNLQEEGSSVCQWGGDCFGGIDSLVISSDSSLVFVGAALDISVWKTDKESCVDPPVWRERHPYGWESLAMASGDLFVVIGEGNSIKIWRGLTPDDMDDLEIPGLLLLLKATQSENSVDLDETPEIRELYESLPERLKKIFDDKKSLIVDVSSEELSPPSMSMKFWKVIKGVFRK